MFVVGLLLLRIHINMEKTVKQTNYERLITEISPRIKQFTSNENKNCLDWWKNTF